MPDGAQLLRSTDSARVKALALPFRRKKRMLEPSGFTTINELTDR